MSGETTLTVVGNLTRDPELKFLPSGVGVASFSIASTPRTFDKSTNAYKDGEPLFLNCSCWREMAEQVCESLQRGMRVIATGRLTQRSWETKEGEKKTVFELQVDEIGPSLRYATAQVKKMQRTSGASGQGGQRPPQGGGNDDPWASQPTDRPSGFGGKQTSSFDDSNPPF